MIRLPQFFLVLPLILAGGCRHADKAGPETAPTGPSVLSEPAMKAALGGRVSFVQHVKPVLESRCFTCHDGKAMPGLFSMATRDSIFQPGARGVRIVPGHPEKSLLFLNPQGTHQSVQVMPPVGNRLTKEELKLLGRWIEQGAEWPKGPEGNLRRAH